MERPYFTLDFGRLKEKVTTPEFGIIRAEVTCKKLNFKKPLYLRESELYALTTINDFGVNTRSLENSYLKKEVFCYLSEY